MANGDNGNGVWKWLATTLGGLAIGVVVATLIATSEMNRMGTVLRNHELLPGHQVMMTKADAIEDDISEIKRLLEQIDQKIDRYHQEQR